MANQANEIGFSRKYSGYMFTVQATIPLRFVYTLLTSKIATIIATAIQVGSFSTLVLILRTTSYDFSSTPRKIIHAILFSLANMQPILKDNISMPCTKYIHARYIYIYYIYIYYIYILYILYIYYIYIYFIHKHKKLYMYVYIYT